MSKSLAINFTAKIKPIRPINEEFTLCKCYILALGKNRNKTIIDEAAVEEALSSLYNIPVVGHVFVDGEGNKRLGGHDMKLEKDEDGKYKFQVLTVPYGTVPEDNEIGYEEVVEPNGETKTYLTANIILWTSRYPELKETVYSEDVWFGQSMEIKAKEIARGKTAEDKNFVHVTKFTFSGLCLLGKSDDANFHYEPCFPEAKVEPVEFELDKEFTLIFEEMKAELALCFSKKTSKEEDGLKPKIINEANADGAGEIQNTTQNAVKHTVTPQSTSALLSYAATYAVRREAIGNALCSFNVSNDAVCVQYYLADFDDKFVYAERYVATVGGGQGKFSKGRMTYEVCADETVIVQENSFQTMLVKWLTMDESASLDRQRDELATLSAYKASQETEAKERKIAAVADTFSDLAEDDAFIELKQKNINFSAEEFDAEKFETECFAIRGKKAAPRSPLKIPVGNDSKTKNSKYGGFFDTYLNKEESK